MSKVIRVKDGWKADFTHKPGSPKKRTRRTFTSDPFEECQHGPMWTECLLCRKFSTKARAEQFIAELRKQEAPEAPKDPRDRTLQECVDFFWKEKEGRLSVKSQERYSQVLNRFLAWCDKHGYIYLLDFCREPFDEMKKSPAQEYEIEVLRSYMHKGRMAHLSAVNAIFKAEIDLRREPIISRSPFYRVRKHYASENKGKPQFLKPQILQWLLDEMNDEEYDTVTLVYATGMRRGEFNNVLKSMREGDIVYLDRHPDWKMKPGAHPFVALNPTASAAWDRLAARSNGPWLIMGHRPCPNHYLNDILEYVVKRVEAKHPEIQWRRTVETPRGPIVKQLVTPHALRRTFGSYLLQAGVSLDRVSKSMRHSTTKVTQDAYADITAENHLETVRHLPNFEQQIARVQ